MRIGIDYRPALVNREGIGRYSRELVRGLIEWELDDKLGLFGYSLAGSRYSRGELGLAGTRVELVRLRLPSRWLRGLLQTLGKGADDLVGGAAVFHHTQPSALAVRNAVETAAVFDCIYVGGAAAGYLDEGTARRMTESYKGLVQRCRRLLVPSDFVGAEVVLALGAHPARVSVAPLGCDHVLRHLPARVEPVRERYVLTVCRVDARKNHVRMLQAFERAVKEGFPQRWLVAGPRGFGYRDFARALERSSARERVEWREDVSDEELPRLYAGADAFLFASLSEGFGLPPLEAMACGAPVVASAVTSLPEVLGDAAVLVEPGESDAIFEGLRAVLGEKDLAEELRRRGRARARRFTWKECAKQTLQAWRKAIEPEKSPPQLRRTL